MRGRKRKSWLAPVAIVTAAVLGYAGTRAYFAYEAEQALDRLARQAAPVVAISWRDVTADITGDITVEGVILRPKAVQDSLQIRRVHADAAGFNGLGRLQQTLREGRIPKSLRLSLEGLTLDVGDVIYTALSGATDGQLWGTRLDGIACGGVRNLHTEVIEALNFDTLELDIDLRLAAQPDEGRLAVFTTVDADRLARTEVAVYLKGDSLRLPQSVTALSRRNDVALTRARLDYTDQGFNDSRNHFCAAEIGASVDAFLQRHLEALRQLHGDDAGSDSGFLDAYAEYARHGGDVEVVLEPSEPLPLARLNALSTTEAATRLNPGLSINGRRVTGDTARWLATVNPASVTAATRATAPAGDGDGGDGSAQASEDAGASATPTSAAASPWQVVAPEQLVAFQGYRARVTTTEGKTYSGRIGHVDGQRLTISVPMEGGYVGYPLEIDRIREARLRR